jgi:hypothetical protein
MIAPLQFRVVLNAVGFMLIAASPAVAGSVTLVSGGEAKCYVVAGKEEDFKEPPAFNWAPKDTLLKWAAEDLAAYLGKMSGATVQVADKPVEGLLPIYVGCAPEAVKLARSSEFGDVYVVDVSDERIILHGESRRAVYYATAHLLNNLGIRWYAPGDLGEVVPSRRTVKAETGRIESGPDFITRALWLYGPEQTRWAYRNRMGWPSAMLECHQGGHGWNAGLPGWSEIGKGGQEKHPEYYSVFDGKPSYQCNIANPEVVKVWAAKGVKEAAAGKPSLGASPDDGYLFDDRPEVQALNSPGPEPILRMANFSDGWFGFLNRVCAEMDKQAPGTKFTMGCLAYMNYIMPPQKVKPDPRIQPIIAPITFNRYTSMGTKDAPTSELLEQVVKDWTKLSPRVGMYLYSFNLADMAMPYTRRVHWTNDFPKLLKLGVKDMTIESHPCWHTMTPGNYVAARVLWDVKTDVKALLDEYYASYYGPAAAAMRRYDTTLENAYETSKVFAGATWGMHRILTPEVMKQLDEAVAEAERKAKGKGVFEQRVEIARISLNFARIWFAARDALNRFDLAEAEKQGAAFMANLKAGNAKYPIFFPPNMEWSPNPERYWELFHNKTLKDAGRIAREGAVIYKLPDELTAHLEVVEGGAKPSGRTPDPQKDEWRPMKTFSASLDEQGFTFFRGVIWYRHEFTLPEAGRDAKSLKLWFGGLDTYTDVWLNGKEVGKFKDTCGPFETDITAALDRKGPNTLVIAVNNTFPNELGTGGILRPVLIYASK